MSPEKATAPETGNSLKAFCGDGEVVLHDLKNYAFALIGPPIGDSGEIKGFAGMVKKLIEEAVKRALDPETSIDLEKDGPGIILDLAKSYIPLIEKTISGDSQNDQFFLKKMLDFILNQYNKKEIIYQALEGEYIDLIGNGQRRLSAVEKALIKVVPVLMPKNIIEKGRPIWKPADHDGMELVFLMNEKLYSTNMVIRPGSLAPKRITWLIQKRPLEDKTRF